MRMPGMDRSQTAGGERGSVSGFLLACLLIFTAGLLATGAIYGVWLRQGEHNSAPLLPMVLATPTLTPAPTLPPEWVGPDGEREHEYVIQDGAYIIGGDGHKIELFNNPEARNPSWSELERFLRRDKTDQQPYEPLSFVCADFAETLHNNAEEAGIRAAFVALDIVDEQDGHALNAFNTSDRGLVYIDDTGLPKQDSLLCSLDKYVIVEVGKEYSPELIFPCGSYFWESLGTVTEVYIQW